VVEGDRKRLVQVLDNLVSNAIEYTPSETEVDATIGRDGDRVVVTVSDRGPGIPVEARADLFQPFPRLASAAGASGPGLGLFITRAIVEAHGGTIKVASAASGWSAFTGHLLSPRDGPGGSVAETTPA
jgi:signal transduction histidine kinase